MAAFQHMQSVQGTSPRDASLAEQMRVGRSKLGYESGPPFQLPPCHLSLAISALLRDGRIQ
eukprot:10377109-Alexandrium_andersonii.AAC.1